MLRVLSTWYAFQTSGTNPGTSDSLWSKIGGFHLLSVSAIWSYNSFIAFYRELSHGVKYVLLLLTKGEKEKKKPRGHSPDLD